MDERHLLLLKDMVDYLNFVSQRQSWHDKVCDNDDDIDGDKDGDKVDDKVDDKDDEGRIE